MIRVAIVYWAPFLTVLMKGVIGWRKAGNLMSFSPNTGLPNSNIDGAIATQPAVCTLDFYLQQLIWFSD